MLKKLLKKIWIAEAKLSFDPLKVDRKKCLIYGVKIIGFDSDNGRKYLPEALKKALPLYEGIKVNVDHPDDPSDTRSAYDRCGKLINVRFVEGKGLFGDLWLNPGHRIFESVFSAAEQMPDLFGLSHNAQGEGEKEDGVFVVSKITEVRHVDLVADPATTSSLSEARKMRKLKLKEEDEKEKDEKPVEEYDEPTKEGEEEDKDDLASKVMDALKEADDSDEEKAQKIVDLVKEALKEADGEEDTPEAEEGDEDKEEDTTEAEEEDTEEEDTEESSRHKKSSKLEQLQEEIRAIKKEAFIRRLCESEGLPVTRQLVEDFKPLKKASIARHVKRLALAHKQTKPRSGVPVTESKQTRIPAGGDLYNWLQN